MSSPPKNKIDEFYEAAIAENMNALRFNQENYGGVFLTFIPLQFAVSIKGQCQNLSSVITIVWHKVEDVTDFYRSQQSALNHLKAGGITVVSESEWKITAQRILLAQTQMFKHVTPETPQPILRTEPFPLPQKKRPFGRGK